ncbi:MAG: AmmeMemoRadiSam system radical SAM enzyme [Candidatus Altiarchaeota archaeon]|nr:AmmeMemoRadiSam system radical SAM enzyme [Candidatus Altiarchaeota archaeon]
MDKKKVSRREFLGKLALAGAGVAAGGYLASRILSGYDIASSTFNNSAPKELWKWSKEAYHYLKLGENVKCQVCPHQCLLKEGDRSICRNKVNLGGVLYTLAYGNPCSMHLDPIEKKPLYHFLPKSQAYSIATTGCNFRCLNCQNYQISQAQPEDTTNADLMPDKVVDAALSSGSSSIAYTYSEPVAFYEYMYDTAQEARRRGVRNVMVTNGYINTVPLRELAKYLDGVQLDLKGFREESYNKLNGGTLQPPLDSLKTLKEEGVWFEASNLVVPTWSDDLDAIREMSQWLVKNIGTDHPLHFLRFQPQYKLAHLPPTPAETLEKARKIAMDAGLKYVYIGNIPNHEAENTICPKCGKLLIERKGFTVVQSNVSEGACKYCGETIAGVWK